MLADIISSSSDSSAAPSSSQESQLESQSLRIAPLTQEERQASQSFAQELRSEVIAIELNINKIGLSRSMTDRQKGEVADHFRAERRAVGGTKKLYTPNQPELKKIESILCQVRFLWWSMTIQYKRGVRLLRKEQLPRFIAEFNSLQEELKSALIAADANYSGIIDSSRRFLGDELFNIADYPSQFVGSIHISWGVFNFNPSDELLKLAPETYQREQQRVRKQFELAIEAYESEAREQLAKLIEGLMSKLTEAQEGKKVKFTEAATTNLREFFDRFDSLGIKSDESLTALVESAKAALGGVTMSQLKKSSYLRASIANSFNAVQQQLSTLIVEAPARSIDLDDLED